MQAKWLLSTCFWHTQDYICLRGRTATNFPKLAQSPSPKALKWERKMGWSLQNLSHLNNDVSVSKGWNISSNREMFGHHFPKLQEFSSSIFWGCHLVLGLWFSRLRWLLRKGRTGSTFGCIKIHGLSESPECKLMAKSGSSQYCPFQEGSSHSSCCWKSWSLTAHCWVPHQTLPLAKVRFLILGYPPLGVSLLTLSNECLIQGHKGLATWL